MWENRSFEREYLTENGVIRKPCDDAIEVSLEAFVFYMIRESQGCKYLYNSILKGLVAGIISKYQIYCNNTYDEVYSKFQEVWETITLYAIQTGRM